MSREIDLRAFNLCLDNLMLSKRKERESKKRYRRRTLFSGGIRVAVNLLDKFKLEHDLGFRNFLRRFIVWHPVFFESLLLFIFSFASQVSRPEDKRKSSKLSRVTLGWVRLNSSCLTRTMSVM